MKLFGSKKNFVKRPHGIDMDGRKTFWEERCDGGEWLKIGPTLALVDIITDLLIV
jgi:hypothetical protein